MKCKKQPAFLLGRPTPITDLWEVRLPRGLWSQISAIAKQRRTTFSTITRYCVFRLANRTALRWRKEMVKLHAADRAECKSAGTPHRHIVCFYGDDLKIVRLAALELGITVSAFIRLALRFFLRLFAMEKQSKRNPNKAALFWYAIKIWIKLLSCPQNSPQDILLLRYLPTSFPPEYRWGMP